MLKLTAKLAVFGLVAMLLAPAVMACLSPASSLNAEERACCREMANECGDMDMPSSHSCCKTLSGPDQNAVAKVSFKLSTQLELAYFVQPLEFSATIPLASHVVAILGRSPPETPTAAFEILRT
jgi:hypothetical protein